MSGFHNRLKRLLDEVRAERSLEEILTQLLAFSDKQLELVVKPVLGSLNKFGQSESGLSQDDEEHLSHLIGLVAALNESLSSGAMSNLVLQQLVSDHQSLISSATYLPESFRGSQQVLGALALVARSRRMRLGHDAPQEAIRWRENTGEPVFCESVGQLQRQYPFLKPVIFSSHANLSEPELYSQYFGGQPGLRSFASAQVKGLFELVVGSQPVGDCYALCPLPSWRADGSCGALLLEDYTWSEQLQELIRLRRKFPGVTIRFATMTELMFLDFSMRLATAESPFGIWSFRCQHPEKPDGCLTYGHVGDYGAEIGIDEKPEGGMLVMPLFVLKVEKKKGE